MNDDVARILAYEEQLQRGELPGTLTTTDAPLLQCAWDLYTERAGFARTDAWTGTPRPRRTAWQRFYDRGMVYRHFEQVRNIAMAVVCGGALWTAGASLTHVLEGEWPHRNDVAPSVSATQEDYTEIIARGLPTVTAIAVPPVGGAAGSRLIQLPDGTRIYLAPGGSFTYALRDQSIPIRGYNAELRGEARIEMTKMSKDLEVFTPVAHAFFNAQGTFAMRASSDETIVSTLAGKALVRVGRTAFAFTENPVTGQTVRVRSGTSRPEFVKAVQR